MNAKLTGATALLVIHLLEVLLVSAALYLVFIWSPVEKEMGIVQKIFYFHVACAWNAFLAFFVVFIASVGYLARRAPLWDRLARSSCEMGVLFCTGTLIAGSLWAKPAWNVWWTWDPRLTTTLVLWFISVAYLMLRAATGESEAGARSAAVLGIIGFLDVPVVFFSVVWWRTMHLGIIVGRSGGSLAPGMGLALTVSVVAFTALLVRLVILRMMTIDVDARSLRVWTSLRR